MEIFMAAQLSNTDIKRCSNRKPATQNAMFKPINKQNRVTRCQFRGGIPIERETMGSKPEKVWHKNSINNLCKALCAHKDCTFWFSLKRISLQISTVQVQISIQKARHKDRYLWSDQRLVQPLVIKSAWVSCLHHVWESHHMELKSEAGVSQKWKTDCSVPLIIPPLPFPF